MDRVVKIRVCKMLNLRRIATGSLHLWKGDMKIIASPMRMAPISSFAKNANRPLKGTSSSAEKNSIFEKLRSLMGETLDFIMREEEKKGVSVTQAELVSTAEQLVKEGKLEYALEIFEWMDRKKMEFSPLELNLFVDIIAKTKGLDAAYAYFKKADPDFDEMDPRRRSRNWLTFVTLYRLDREASRKRGLRLAVIQYRNGVLVND